MHSWLELCQTLVGCREKLYMMGSYLTQPSLRTADLSDTFAVSRGMEI